MSGDRVACRSIRTRGVLSGGWAIASLVVAFAGCLAPGSGAPSAAAGDELAWMLGTWSGVRRAADDGSEALMRVRVEALPGGDGQVECLEVDSEPGRYVGFTLRTPDAASGGWRMVYVNSAGRRFAQLVGEIEGSRTTWRSVTPGRTRESRLVSERVDAGRWRKTQHVSDDGGATWRVLFVDELARAAGE